MKTLAWALVAIALVAADVGYTAILGTQKYPGYEGLGAVFLLALIGFVLCAVLSA